MDAPLVVTHTSGLNDVTNVDPPLREKSVSPATWGLFSSSLLSLLPSFIRPSSQISPPKVMEGAMSTQFREIGYADVPDGLSGLARDRDGTLWAVSETSYQLVALTPSSDTAPQTMAIRGVPADLELESIAFMDDGRLAIGTEANTGHRTSDAILFAERNSEGFKVSGKLDVPYGMWNLYCSANEGIEAICAADGMLVVASETAFTTGSIWSQGNRGRAAPLGVYDTVNGSWRAMQLPLSTATGKIAGLACRKAETQDGTDKIEFIAIERDFKVRRGLHWTMDKTSASPIAPTVLFDISHDSADNPEGIEWTARGAIAMVTDNFFRSKRWGLSKLLMLSPAQ